MITQEEKWMHHYQEILSFLEDNRRNPSKYDPEERQMLHWIKYNRKRLAAGHLTPARQRLFAKLEEKAESLKRPNQYVIR